MNSLFAIISFVKSQAGESVSLKIKNRIFRTARNLPKFPYSGKIEPLLVYTGKEYRFKTSGYYKVIYRIENNTIFIIDVFDCRQDPEKLSKRIS